MAELCPDCRRPTGLTIGGCAAHQRNAEAYGWVSECQTLAIARLKSELAAVEKLKELCLERGRTPSLSNQVRLDEMCREMAIAHGDQEKP